MEKLSYDANLTLEKAEQRFQEALQEFNDIKKRYTGGFLHWREYKLLMSERNRKRTVSLACVLSSLQLQPSVKNQVEQVPREETLSYKSSVLKQYAMDMLSSFPNTGTGRVGYSKSVWRDALPFE